ncbi:AraC family transcriptional regulator [Ruania zhangjianzhongii]|uniref:AraC family transcriptional regulator n=1 Tax=Ruania zhangjianzhongii TaxID=2603206 RepID=UPI0011C6F1F8|nr:helix-turn-helix domain-containing protein [Ruania zhangjianzhongii]
MGTEQAVQNEHPQQDESRQDEGVPPYTFLAAAPALPGLVASTVGYHSSGQRPGVHRGLPSPHLTFIISLDEPIATGESPEHLASSHAYSNEVLVAGLHTAPAYVRQPSHEAGIEIAVHPLAARVLFGAPAGELDPLTVEGTDLLGAEIARLRYQLLEQPDWPRRFDLIADYLRRRTDTAGRAGRVRPELVEAWTWMARHRGTGSMRGLAEHVALSPRQLRTLFDREVGHSPKVVSRLMRFQHASQQVAQGASTGYPRTLAEVAHRCGYYDQSHLVREFRELTHAAPTEWITQERRIIQAGGHLGGADSSV